MFWSQNFLMWYRIVHQQKTIRRTISFQKKMEKKMDHYDHSKKKEKL